MRKIESASIGFSEMSPTCRLLRWLGNVQASAEVPRNPSALARIGLAGCPYLVGWKGELGGGRTGRLSCPR
jgi:hypothetical protein